MFLTDNYSSKFTIMSFWAPSQKSLVENGIPKYHLIRSLILAISDHFAQFLLQKDIKIDKNQIQYNLILKLK